LPLLANFDLTLARIGRRTRIHLRYYRRRAERDLGCTFVPDVSISLPEMLALNRLCKYRVPDEVCVSRHQSVARIAKPFLGGIRDREGQWLSIAGGRISAGALEIDWQMNRADHPKFSLSAVLRAYLIDHAATMGLTRFQLAGGTTHPIQRSFLKARATDILILRPTLVSRLIRRMASTAWLRSNYLAQLLADPALVWHRG
jgi:hypothetical protein